MFHIKSVAQTSFSTRNGQQRKTCRRLCVARGCCVVLRFVRTFAADELTADLFPFFVADACGNCFIFSGCFSSPLLLLSLLLCLLPCVGPSIKSSRSLNGLTASYQAHKLPLAACCLFWVCRAWDSQPTDTCLLLDLTASCAAAYNVLLSRLLPILFSALMGAVSFDYDFINFKIF